MPNMALIPSARTRIPVLLDVVHGYPTDSHRLETVTGGDPLEDGLMVTDHAVARQERLVLSGIVSDFDGQQRPIDAWTELRRIHKEIEVVEVYTEWGHYPSRCSYAAAKLTTTAEAWSLSSNLNRSGGWASWLIRFL